MKKPYGKPMTAAEIAATTDRDIDFSDMPELDDAFWQNARLVEPDRTQSVTLRVKKSVLEAYKAQGKGYQTRMNAVLESYARTLQKHH
ncbi:BrnA antitoxin family protein [Acidisphaera sp. S103]|uniref:BrnA antitoxin family protein n=1 Tax=Acidisphaera sp. S103 TaxID=1747223 RepID=UPI00131BB10A|nr:BrnA antitoxin family protein [Acidisphaera sp. S103]